MLVTQPAIIRVVMEFYSFNSFDHFKAATGISMNFSALRYSYANGLEPTAGKKRWDPDITVELEFLGRSPRTTLVRPITKGAGPAEENHLAGTQVSGMCRRRSLPE